MTKKEAQLGALRGGQWKPPELTGSQIRNLEAQRYFGTPVASMPTTTGRQVERETAGEILSGLGWALEKADPITQLLRAGGRVAGLSPEDQLTLELAAGPFTPGPGELATAGKAALVGKAAAVKPLLLGNVFALPPSRVSKKALGEITEKWLRTGEKAAEMGEKEVLSKVIENLTSLGKTAEERDTLRKAAAEYLRGARSTIFKKGTELGETMRRLLLERGPTGKIGLRVAPKEAGTSTYAAFAQEPGGIVNLSPEALESPFGRARSLGHEMGEAFQVEAKRQGADPELLKALEDAAYLQKFRAPESEQALSLIARRAGTGRQEALQLAKEEPQFVAREVMTGRPHGATAEDMARERVADLLADLSTATGQSRLSDAQIRALRGKVGLLFPQP